MEQNVAARGTAPLLSIKDIYKSFGLNAVLKGISLDIIPGEVLALIGGNGAGKSTLMKIVMGIYTHDSGELAIRGKPVVLNRPSAALAQGIYMVPQEPLLFPNMTVEENIIIGFPQGKSELHRELLSVIIADCCLFPMNRFSRSHIVKIASLAVTLLDKQQYF